MTASDEVALLVNPTAGRGRAARLIDPVRAVLGAAGREVRLLVGADAAEAEALAGAAVADGVAALAVLGGDGLAHIGVQAVAGTPTPLAVLPAGTGNDLATALGMPADPVAAAQLVCTGRTRAVDAGRAEFGGATRWWATVWCAGFDSRVNERANRMRWPRGPVRYDLAVYIELARLHTVRMRLLLDETPWEGEITLIAVGNAPSYGGGMRICPGAVPDDGVFDVTAFGPVTRRQAVRMKPLVRTGDISGHPAALRWRVRELRIEAAEASTDVVAYADGERIGPLPMTVTCVPNALNALVPAENLTK